MGMRLRMLRHLKTQLKKGRGSVRTSMYLSCYYESSYMKKLKSRGSRRQEVHPRCQRRRRHPPRALDAGAAQRGWAGESFGHVTSVFLRRAKAFPTSSPLPFSPSSRYFPCVAFPLLLCILLSSLPLLPCRLHSHSLVLPVYTIDSRAGLLISSNRSHGRYLAALPYPAATAFGSTTHHRLHEARDRRRKTAP